jgi:hypothetical protein
MIDRENEATVEQTSRRELNIRYRLLHLRTGNQKLRAGPIKYSARFSRAFFCKLVTNGQKEAAGSQLCTTVQPRFPKAYYKFQYRYIM